MKNPLGISSNRVGKGKITSFALLMAVMLPLLLAYNPFIGAIHSSTADLDPEFSSSGKDMFYTVTISNFGPDVVDEVRIYKNPLYGGFTDSSACENKAGWEKQFIESKKSCAYITRIENNGIVPGESDTFQFRATAPKAGCELEWKFETRDINGTRNNGTYVTLFDTTGIDNNSPIINKIVGDPKFICSGQECDFFVTPKTVISFDIKDSGECREGSGLDQCILRHRLKGGEWKEVPIEEFPFNFSFSESSEHELEVQCADGANNVGVDKEIFRVDAEAPITEKTIGNPLFPQEGFPQWISLETPITLKATDPNPQHASGVRATYWRNTLVADELCRNEESCIPCTNQNCPQWITYEGTIQNQEESCHLLEFYSIDNVNNAEQVQSHCMFVDATPPTITKELSDPKISCEEIGDDSCHFFITQNTNITLTCIDAGPHPSGNVTIFWRVRVVEGNNSGEWQEFVHQGEKVIFTFPENGDHELEYACIDAVENRAGPFTEIDKVSVQQPEIVKTVEGPQKGSCPPQQNDTCIIKANKTVIHVDVIDAESNQSAQGVSCQWGYTWKGSFFGWNEDAIPFQILFGEDSSHNLTIHCTDTFEPLHDEEIFLVDGKPPVTTKTYSQPHVMDTTGDACARFCAIREENVHQCIIQRCQSNQTVEWIGTKTSITLNAADEKSGVDETVKRVSRVDDQFCWNAKTQCQPCKGENCGEFSSYSIPFSIEEESCHLIEFYSTDQVNNTENRKWQCTFVDATAPEGNKTVGQPSIPCTNNQCDYMVGKNTPITLDCKDKGDHPVGQEKLFWRILPVSGVNDVNEINGNLPVNNGTGSKQTNQENRNIMNRTQGWKETENIPFTLHFTEDAPQILEFFCEDGLNNRNEIDREIFVVKSGPPESNLSFTGPVYDNGTSTWVDRATFISIITHDPDEPTGAMTSHYKVSLVEEASCLSKQVCAGRTPTSHNSSDWTLFTKPFNLPEESCHVIEHFSADSAGNKENVKWSCIFADHTPPITSIKAKGPSFSCAQWCELQRNDTEACMAENCDTDNGTNAIYPLWVSDITTLSFTALDPQPNPSGVKQTFFRVTEVQGSEACQNRDICLQQDGGGDLGIYSNESNISFDGCGVVEFFSIDNVNKTEEVQKECLFVQSQGPLPNKTVGEPNTKWDGKGNQTWYPDLQQRCWNGQNNSFDCWKVSLRTPITLDCSVGDGALDTMQVCFNVELDKEDLTEEYCQNKGVMEDGSCCLMKQPPITGHFHESSYHKLDFYCKDALGNKGPVDSEFFNVEGSPFTIPLHKRWNLISIPFVPFDERPSEILKGTKNISSVWTYDGSTNQWFVYTPDGNDQNDNLESIMPGWGYWVFAHEDDTLTIGGSLFSEGPILPTGRPVVAGWNLVGHYGTNEKEIIKDPYCADHDTFGRPVLCSLGSLVDTNNGFPKWSSVWTFINCGSHNESWVGLKTCGNSFTQVDSMYAGRGYWVEMEEKDNYAPATTCIWNNNWVCM